MSQPETGPLVLSKYRRKGRSMLRSLAIVVIVLAVLSWTSWQGDLQASPMTSLKLTTMKFKKDNSRQPSSIPETATHVENAIRFDVSCALSADKHPPQFVVSGSYIQLKGKNCNKNIRIQNKTNGYQASYFEAGQGQYKTDLIQLDEGENKILLEYENSRGQKREMLVLVTSRRI